MNVLISPFSPFLKLYVTGLLGYESKWVSSSMSLSCRLSKPLIFLMPSSMRALVTFLLARILSVMWMNAALPADLVMDTGVCVGWGVGMMEVVRKKKGWKIIDKGKLKENKIKQNY